MIDDYVRRIHSRFASAGYKVEEDEIRRRLDLLINEFKVPVNEAVRSVTNYFLKELDLSPDNLVAKRESPEVKISEIDEPGRWVTVKVKIVQLWESESENISQVGLAGDETGTIKFVIWRKSGKPTVEEGKSYVLRNVVTDSFMGRMQININKLSEIEEIDEDIEVSSSQIEVVGALVAIQSNSGLITRCPECNRVLSKNVCPEHGKVEGIYDLRIKGVIDNGESVFEVILNEENLKHLTGMDVESAKKMAEDSLDRTSVLDYLKNLLFGRYLKISGTRMGRYMLVNEVDFITSVDSEELEKLLEVV